MKNFFTFHSLLAFLCLSFTANAQVPTLYSPSDNATNMINPVSFDWSYVSSGWGYQFQIADNSSFSGASTWDVFTNYTSESGLTPGETYYWRVRTWLGGSNYSSFSSANSFTMALAPVAAFTATPRTVCQGANVSFNSSGSSATSYSWNFQGGTPSTSTSANPVITYNTVGTFNVTLTVTTFMGNDVETKVGYITVAPDFSASLNVTEGKLLKCPGDSVQLSASPIGSGYTYLWSNSATASSIKTTQYGVFSVAIKNSGGCTKNLSKTITRDTLPLYFNVANGASLCYGDSLQLTVLDSGYFNYTWLSGQTTKQILVYQPNTYKVYATDSNTCPRKGSVQLVAPHSTKKMTVSGYANPLCLTDSIRLAGPAGFSSYSWSNSETSPQVFINTAGTYKVIFTDSVGCRGMDSVNLQFVKGPCYNGVYTVGGVAPDFISPKAAMDSLNKYRISGKVTFKIRDGVYNNRLFLKTINGSSKTNNVTFESESGYAPSVTLTSGDSVLFLDNVSYLTIKNLTLLDTAHERLVYSKGLGYGKYLTFEGNNFIGVGAKNITLSTRGWAGSTAIRFERFDSSSFNKNIFKRTYINASFYEINNSEIIANTFDAISRGVNAGASGGGVSYTTITQNSVSTNQTNVNVSTTSDNAGIYFIGGNNNIITRNKVNCLKGAGGICGIKSISSNTLISNNQVFDEQIGMTGASGTGAGGALYIDGNNIVITHNDIIGSPALRFRFYSNTFATSKDSLRVINNTFGLLPGMTGSSKYLLWFENEQGSGPPSNKNIKEYVNNNYYNTDSLVETYMVENLTSSDYGYSKYSSWKAAQTFDKDSRFINPNYVSNYNLTPRNIALNNTADFMATVPTDINGAQRNTPKTDIGSCEINTYKDLKIDSVMLSGAGCNNTVTSKIRLRNNSLFYKVYKNDSVNIYYSINGGTPQTLVHGFKKDSLNFNDTALVNMPGLTLSQGSLNTIRFWINYTSDSAQWNDSISHAYYAYKLPSVDFTNTGFCAGTAVSFTSQTSPVVFYKWSFPDGSFVNAANASKVFTEGNHNITLQVTSAQGCSNTITKQITVLSQPSIAVTRTGDSLSAVAGMSYKWYLNNTLLPNDTLQKVKIKQSGNYKVTVTSAQGCSNSSANMFYAVTGIKGFDNTDQVMVYPVPATNLLFIELLRANTGSYILTDGTGKEIVQGTLKQGLNSVEVESMKTGIYFITVRTAAGDQLIRKIIKE
jgi:PKD repeat protein